MDEIIINDEKEYLNELNFSKSIYSEYLSKFYMVRYQLRRTMKKDKKQSRIETINELQEILIFIANEEKGVKPKILGL